MQSSSKSILLCNALLDHPHLSDARQCLLLAQGRIAWIGARSDAPAADRVIDVQGLRIIPALTDAHAHLFMRAQELIGVSLGPQVGKIADLLECVRIACESVSQGEWVLSADYSEQFLEERRHPTVEELDAVSQGRPVLLRRTGGHLSVANSAALHIAGLHAATPDPPGGTIERQNGRLTGVLTENAADMVAGFAPPPSTSRTIAMIRAVAQACLSYGISSVVEAAVGFSNGFDTEWEIWNEIRRSGGLPLRMGFMLRIDPTTALQYDLKPTPMDPWWQVRTLKFFVDGIIGARTAAFTEPYVDGAGTGLFMEDPRELRQKVIAAHAAGWQLAAHVIGDRAIDLWLDCLEDAQRQSPRIDARHRLEHLAVPSESAPRRISDLGAIVVPQYAFLHRLGDSFARAVGPSRAQRLYPGRSLFNAGIRIAGSSDHPIGPLSPFLGMSAAVNRLSSSNAMFNAAEALSIEEALAAYAQGGAFAMGQETVRGYIAPGQAGDLAILDRDVLRVGATMIAETKSRLTLIDGQIVYSDGALAEKT